MPTALPSPVAASTARPAAGGKAGAKKLDYATLKAGYDKMKNMGANLKARQGEIVENVVVTAEIQAGVFGASLLSGFMHAKGKSLKVMGIDSRAVVGGGMALTGIMLDSKASTHLLAVGNGVLGSLNAELAFDLGVKLAQKGQGAAAPGAAAPTTAPAAAPAVQGLDDEPPVRLLAGSDDEIGARGFRGPGRRRVRVARLRAGEMEADDDSSETAGDDEVGALGLEPNERFANEIKLYDRFMKMAKIARLDGADELAAERRGIALTHKQFALNIYRKWGKKFKLALPAAWKKRPAHSSSRSEATESRNFAPAGRSFTKPAARPIPRVVRASVNNGNESSDYDFGEDDDRSADDGFSAFDAAVLDMSDSDLASMAGLDEEIGDGTIDPDELS